MDTRKNWKTVSLLVCVFAMVREIRPIKPFITSYLKSMNFSLNQNDVPETSKSVKIKNVEQMIFDDFKSAYKNSYVVKKSCWWILAFVGHFLVGLFIQVVWENANNNKRDLMNGAVESIHTLCGAAGAYTVSHLHYDWKKFGDIIFTVGTFVLASLLFIIYYCDTLWILYLVYIIFGTCFQVLLTVTTSEVAKHIKPDSYGLIFGFNLFMSLLIISIYTLLFIQGLIVAIEAKNQILSVSMMFASMSALLFIMAVWKFTNSRK